MISCFHEFFESVISFEVESKEEKLAQMQMETLSKKERKHCILDMVDSIFRKYAKKSQSIIHRDEMQAYLYTNIKSFF